MQGYRVHLICAVSGQPRIVTVGGVAKTPDEIRLSLRRLGKITKVKYSADISDGPLPATHFPQGTLL